MTQVKSISFDEIVQRLGIKNDTVYKWVRDRISVRAIVNQIIESIRER